MSSTNRGGAARVHLDQYYTPDDVAKACVDTLDLTGAKRVIEPSVGGGAFVRAIRAAAPQAHIVGYDLDPTVAGQHDCDVFAVQDWPTVQHHQPVDVVLGNPPYTGAQAHIEHAFRLTRPGGIVGMLLRLAFAEGVGRKAFWAQYGPWLDGTFVPARRPSFTGGSTDSCAYAWFVWRVGGPGRRVFVPGWSW